MTTGGPHLERATDDGCFFGGCLAEGEETRLTSLGRGWNRTLWCSDRVLVATSSREGEQGFYLCPL
jgi:hypothetical protein